MKIEATPMTGIVMTLTLDEGEINTLYSVTEYTDEIVEALNKRGLLDNEDFSDLKVCAILLDINKALRQI